MVKISDGIFWIHLQNIHDFHADVCKGHSIYRATKKRTTTRRWSITGHKKNPKQTYRLAVVLQSSREANIDRSKNGLFSVSDTQGDSWNMVMVYRRSSLAIYGQSKGSSQL